jgi:hypothetical protein
MTDEENMNARRSQLSRRRFVQGSAALAAEHAMRETRLDGGRPA